MAFQGFLGQLPAFQFSLIREVGTLGNFLVTWTAPERSSFPSIGRCPRDPSGTTQRKFIKEVPDEDMTTSQGTSNIPFHWFLLLGSYRQAQKKTISLAEIPREMSLPLQRLTVNPRVAFHDSFLSCDSWELTPVRRVQRLFS